MEIIVDGRLAALKKNSSFEFISENRFFTDADSYTLSITFPLRGCKQNIDIFGHINRKDHDLLILNAQERAECFLNWQSHTFLLNLEHNSSFLLLYFDRPAALNGCEAVFSA